MKVLKKVQGSEEYIILELEKIKDYSNYSLYQVYKFKDGKRIPLYRRCYTDLEIRELKNNHYVIEEEVFE